MSMMLRNGVGKSQYVQQHIIYNKKKEKQLQKPQNQQKE